MHFGVLELKFESKFSAKVFEKFSAKVLKRFLKVFGKSISSKLFWYMVSKVYAEQCILSAEATRKGKH